MTGSPLDGAPWWAKIVLIPAALGIVLIDKLKFWKKR
jgi:hypothetical protein